MAERDNKPVADAEVPRLFASFLPFDHVFLAVSGGPDSMALMHLAKRWLEGVSPACSLHVLTVDHGLRPEARHEATWVEAAARELGFAAHQLTIDEIAPTSGLQAWARARRYEALLSRARKESGRVAIATGHHQDDLAETVLMRLARGSGVDGLAAMRASGRVGSIHLLRPLLELTKGRLLATLRATNTSWLEDPSNDRPEFERVRLRRARPARDELGLTDRALALTAKRAARASAALEAGTDEFLKSLYRSTALQRFGAVRWPGSGHLADEIAIRALSKLIRMLSGTGETVRLAKLEQLWETLNDPAFGGCTMGGCRFDPTQDGSFWVYREFGRTAPEALRIQPGDHAIWDGRFEVSSSTAISKGLTIRQLMDLDLSEAGFMKPVSCELPRSALKTTPAIDDAKGLLAVPALDYVRPGSDAVFGLVRCHFVLRRTLRDGLSPEEVET